MCSETSEAQVVSIDSLLSSDSPALPPELEDVSFCAVSERAGDLLVKDRRIDAGGLGFPQSLQFIIAWDGSDFGVSLDVVEGVADVLVESIV